jgi:hypothetical protein
MSDKTSSSGRDSQDSWSVDTETVRKRLEDRGPTAEVVLVLCQALDDLRSWNTSLSGRLMEEIETLNRELVVQRRANASLLQRLGQAEIDLTTAQASMHALAEITANVVNQRDEAQAAVESQHLP